jgi:release factor glutamine methyltransferase
MIIENWAKKAIEELTNAGIGTAELDVQVLLADVLNISRAQVLAHPETELASEQIRELESMIERRSKHEPLAYIRGKVEFYGEEFYVDKRVLVPRPETEAMLDELKKLKPSAIYDVGTGSGAIAIIAKKLFPSKQVIAIDNDPNCLEVATKNAKMHGAAITIQKNHLLEGCAFLPGMVVLANLPYVPENFAINQAALNEPQQAIFGGKDGLDLYRRMFKQIGDAHKKPTYVITEALPPQHNELIRIATEVGYTQKTSTEFVQVFVLN